MELPKLNDFLEGLQRSWDKARILIDMAKETMNKQFDKKRRNLQELETIYVLQTSFSLYFHNQWTDFHKLSCAGKPQMRAICTYVGGIKATTNDWDIRLLVAIKALFANISWTAEQIYTIELVLKSAHQSVSNNIWYVSKQ